MTLVAQLKEKAAALGFVRVGVAEAGPLTEETQRLHTWLAQGFHGSMDYMQTHAEVRCNVQHPGMLPTAKSVIVMATPYAGGKSVTPVRVGEGRVARYAWGRDYHNVIYKRGQKLGAWLRGLGFNARVAVDSMPVFERAWAVRAGLGFIGKNCCLIIPGLGSHVFLSAIVTDAELEPDPIIQERCGQCTRCLEACPTQAFVDERVLDARKCISYLTIEHRGDIDPALQEPIGDWLFGCDFCQDVCPFNQAAAIEAATDPAFFPATLWNEVTLESFGTMSAETFARWAQGSAVKRAGQAGMARNAAIVIDNTLRRRLPVIDNKS